MTQNKILDEISKLAGSALQAKDAFVNYIKQHIDEMFHSKELVSRDEFEALKVRIEKLESTSKRKIKTIKIKKS